MKPMRIVKVFIASSEELQPERERFDTLFNHLNNIKLNKDQLDKLINHQNKCQYLNNNNHHKL